MTDPQARLTAALAGRYRVERELGRGGMATVYLARDLRHNRGVAVKVLRPDIAGAIGADRFLREIEIAAQLSHPHILPLYDSGEADGLLYYVMPFVEGESLRDRLEREGQLPLEDALQITREVADGLAYAHGRGLVHRDIKPENILITGGHAVIADFGIAKAVTEAAGGRMTATGLAVGTPAYMSPEQWAGSTTLDGRSDLYSLGCMLYELLVGESPYAGTTPQVILARQSLEAIPSVRLVRPAVRPGVEAAIVKALAKVPADRFASTLEFAAALTAPDTPRSSAAPAPAPRPWRLPAPRLLAGLGLAAALAVGGYVAFARLQSGGSQGSRTRLAVLPFENLGRGDDEYFSDGITEEITGRLATIDRVSVIARTSAMQYKKASMPVKKIGAELGVAYVIEGSVRWDKSGPGLGRVLVSARLIKVSDGSTVWSSPQYNVQLSDVFTVQSSIAQQVAEALNVALLEPERQRLAARPTDNVEAYDYYLRGNSYYNRSWERPDVETALQMYQRAVQLDRRFALAFAQIGRTNAWLYRLGYDVSEERLRASKTAVDSALTLNQDLPEAHIALGLYYYWGRKDYDHAIPQLMHARDLQPGNALVYQNIGNVLRRQGRFDEAIANYQRAAELDPRSYVIPFNIGETYLYTRRYAPAEREFDRVLSLAPDFLDVYLNKAALSIHRDGNVAAARQTLERAAQQIPPTRWRPIWGFWFLGFSRIVYDNRDLIGRLAPGALGLDTAAYYGAKAEVYERLGQSDRARACYDSARSMLETLGRRFPDQAWIPAELGIVYAALHLPAEALRAARQATEIESVAHDAFDGPAWLVNLAYVQLRLGQPDSAIERLGQALAIPSRVSPNWLRLDPAWAPLRGDPRFQRLVEGKRPASLTGTPGP